MSMKVIIIFAAFSSMVLSTVAILPWNLKEYNVWAKSDKSICPDISLLPFQVSSDIENNGEIEQQLVLALISKRTFKTIKMTVLKKTRDLCFWTKMKELQIAAKLLVSDYGWYCYLDVSMYNTTTAWI